MIQVYVKLLLTAVFWGGTFIAGRAVAGSVHPFAAAFLRFAVASSFLVVLIVKKEGRLPIPDTRQWVPVLLLGMSGVFAYNVFFFKGLERIEAGRAALIIANNPIGIALMSAVIFGERLPLAKIAGVLLSVAGALIVISKGSLTAMFRGGVGSGEMFILGCVASWVTYSLIGKTVMRRFSPLASVTWSALIGAVLLLVPAWREGMAGDVFSYSGWDWLSIFYLGFFGTVLGFVWYYEGIQKIGPTKAGQFINFVPISAVVLAFFILGEPITLSLAAGAVLVISGVVLTNRPAAQKRRRR